MSRIEKLSIQGIRSFSPESSEKIEFFIPVTLILGPNGTGKTTIIECLKFATTGELPPGAKVGGSFVHDPKLAQETEVKAKVAVAVKDISGHNLIVSRSLTATQKAKSIQMRTLDGVIKRQLPDGEVKSISSKCAELDREVVASLGVSKPVLESVIFCHQEESNWPLAEGKAVKQRFDDIFASTRYVKALEVIRKTKQEQDQQGKVFKTDVIHLKEQNSKAQELRRDYEEAQVKLAAEDDSLKKVVTKLTPLKDELSAYREKYQDLCTIQSEIDTLAKERSLITDSVNRLKSNVSEAFVGDDSDLKAAIDNAEQSLASSEHKLKDFDRKSVVYRKELERAQQDKNRMLIEKGKQVQEQQEHHNVKQRLYELIEKFSGEEALPGPASDSEMEEKMEFYKILENKLRENERDLAGSKRSFEDKEGSIQRDLDKQRSSISKLEQSKTMKRQQLSKNEREIQRLMGKLADAEKSVDKLKTVKAKLDEAESALKTSERSDCSKTVKSEIEVEKRERSSLEKEVADIDETIAKLMEKSHQMAEKTLLDKDRKEKENAIKKLHSKLNDSLEQIFCGDIPDERLRQSLEMKLRELEDDNRLRSEKVQKVRASSTTVQTEMKLLRQDLNAKREKLKTDEERIQATCGTSSFDDALTSCMEKKKQVESDRSFIQGSMHTYGKFKERLDKDRACPLCHRGFESEVEVQELADELQTKLCVAPRELRQKDREVEQISKKYETLIKLKTVQEEMSVLSTSEIPELEKRLTSKLQLSEKLDNELEEASTVLDMQSSDEGVAKSIQGDVVVLERFENELKALTSKLTELSRSSDLADSSLSMEQLQEKKKAVQRSIQAIDDGIEWKREKLEKEAEMLQQKRKTVNNLRQECLELEQLNQDKMHYASELQKLETENQTLDEELVTEEEEFSPLREAILSLEKERESVKKEKDGELERLRKRTNHLKDCVQQLKQCQDVISKYVSRGKEAKLNQLLRRIEDCETKIVEKETEINQINDSLETLKSDIANHKIKTRELLDCQEIREKTTHIGEIDRKMSSLSDKVGSINVVDLSRNLKQLEKEEENLLKHRQLLLEKKTHLLGQMKQLEKDLKTPIYKEAEERYRTAMHNLKTTEVASSDLDKYYRALDRAIMSYHAYKMEEINKIIKELWRNTYKGNDIDFIEIRSDEDEAGLSRSRRTYNYRVVMVKSDTALDMRGRCSAGQKVLASLIIRLALSEAFCLNCGVLALDEPTTNLDRENIESLAFALVEIIKNRQRQKNFQLIVITHDEDFVELLGRSEYVEHFFRIGRNMSGLSHIKKLKIDEEFH